MGAGETGVVSESDVEWSKPTLRLKVELFGRCRADDRDVRTAVGDTVGPLFVE